MKVLVAHLCLTLCNPLDCNLPGSSVHGIFQTGILEEVAISFSRGFSQLRDLIQLSRIAGAFFTIWATRKAHLGFDLRALLCHLLACWLWAGFFMFWSHRALICELGKQNLLCLVLARFKQAILQKVTSTSCSGEGLPEHVQLPVTLSFFLSFPRSLWGRKKAAEVPEFGLG